MAGLRDYASILCGTSPSGDVADVGSSLLGCVYIAFYFLFVIVVPILVIAALLVGGHDLWRRRAKSISQ
jgi:hypothetical protein